MASEGGGRPAKVREFVLTDGVSAFRPCRISHTARHRSGHSDEPELPRDEQRAGDRQSDPRERANPEPHRHQRPAGLIHPVTHWRGNGRATDLIRDKK